jgi:hypothetical protein
MNPMKPLFRPLFVAAALWAGSTSVLAQRDTLGVLPVKPLPAIADKLAKAGKTSSLNLISQSLAEQQLDVLNATRKFQIVSRSDLADLVKDDERGSTLSVDKIKGFNLAEAKYLLVTSIDDFEDQTERLVQKLAKTTIVKRTVRLSLIAKIYEASSGKLLESAANTISKTDAKESMNEAGNDAESTDALLRDAVRESADWIGGRVVDVIYPAKIIAKTDKVVSINRGDGTGVAVGQVWRAFAVGEEMIDPDTKESLGREEVAVGRVKITDVLPKFSKAEVVEDLGIDKGAVLRR